VGGCHCPSVLLGRDLLERTTDTLWTQVVRAAFQHATGRGAVEQPTSRTYRWVGDVDTE
jgi:hypothetical protein